MLKEIPAILREINRDSTALSQSECAKSRNTAIPNRAGLASDLSRDTFVRILAVQESQRELTVQELRAYLTIIAHRLLINHIKRVSLEQAYLDVLPQIPEPETMSAETRMLIHETLHMGKC